MENTILPSRSDIPIEQTIVGVIERCSLQAMRAHQGLEVIIEANPRARKIKVTGGRLLPLVFDNLLRNAAIHVGSDVEVHIKVERKGKEVQIKFRDNGEGIPDDMKQGLFGRGFSTTGSGLGLYLSKRVIEHYGGSIELIPETKPYTGASFKILLPIA